MLYDQTLDLLWENMISGIKFCLKDTLIIFWHLALGESTNFIVWECGVSHSYTMSFLRTHYTKEKLNVNFDIRQLLKTITFLYSLFSQSTQIVVVWVGIWCINCWSWSYLIVKYGQHFTIDVIKRLVRWFVNWFLSRKLIVRGYGEKGILCTSTLGLGLCIPLYYIFVNILNHKNYLSFT